MDAKLLALYFFLGGTIVALVTYFGGQGKGLLAAFVACFPAVTVTTLSAIYLKNGIGGATSYVKGILFIAPAWLLYVGIVLFLLPKVGFVLSLVIGILLYIGSSMLIMRFVH